MKKKKKTLNERKNFFATSLPALDQCLHGGIPFSTITEVLSLFFLTQKNKSINKTRLSVLQGVEKLNFH